VTRWTPREDAFTSVPERGLRAALAACFAQRRRTLRGNVQRALGEGPARALLDAARVDGGLRAEALDQEAWRRLGGLWPEGRA
jgi:16S rRNA A1518/A1519 N6-dimethyltransferase RsmA/KsgA/DIM1 with predicted DNA glycosylase/AP lyase activity